MSAQPPRSVSRLLCVDDDPDTVELLRTLLGFYGYEVVTTSTVEEALDLAKRREFALIILDNRFGTGSGVELCRLIRSFDQDTPILFHSAAAYPADVQEALSAGANGYVFKPSDPDEVVREIRRLTSGS